MSDIRDLPIHKVIPEWYPNGVLKCPLCKSVNVAMVSIMDEGEKVICHECKNEKMVYLVEK